MQENPPSMPTIPNSPTGTPPKGNSPKAITSLVLGILSFLCCGCGFFLGIPAIILGVLELQAIKRGESAENNKVLSIIGIVLGGLGVLVGIIYLVVYLIYGIALFTGLQNNPSSF